MMNTRSVKQSIRRRPPAAAPSRQRGYFALLTAALLIAACLLAIRGVANGSMLEVKVTTNDQSAMETTHAAEAAWEYGLAWYTETEPVWATNPSDPNLQQGVPDTAPPSVAASNGDFYNTTVAYSRSVTQTDFVLITATATAVSNPSITATVAQYVHTNYLLNYPGISLAPLSIEGCLSNVNGTPDIYVDTAGNTAVRTSTPPDCLAEGHLDYNGGVEDYEAWSGDLWDDIFTISRMEMKAIADAEVAAGVPDAERTVVWMTDPSPYHESWGSPTNPVILVFAPEANCPHTNGNPTHYGVIFVDSDCNDGAHGWGGTEVFGGVAVNGDIGKYNSNTEITGWSGVPDGDDRTLKADWVARIPGSWRDF